MKIASGFALLALTACGGVDEVPRADVCDGSSDLALYAAVVGGGNPTPADRLNLDLGHNYLFITGDCRAFISGARAGESLSLDLTPAQAADVGETVGFGAWPDTYGSYGGDFQDASTEVFSDGDGEVACLAGCAEADDPLVQTFDLLAAIEQVRDLGATPLDAGGWILVSAVDRASGDLPTVEWPTDGSVPRLAELLDTFENADLASVGLPLSPSEAAVVRALFEMSRTEVGGFGTEGDVVYEVWFRDALPIEDQETGRVSPPVR